MNDTEYTPTTADVRFGYSQSRHDHLVGIGRPKPNYETLEAEFDRWLDGERKRASEESAALEKSARLSAAFVRIAENREAAARADRATNE